MWSSPPTARHRRDLILAILVAIAASLTTCDPAWRRHNRYAPDFPTVQRTPSQTGATDHELTPAARAFVD